MYSKFEYQEFRDLCREAEIVEHYRKNSAYIGTYVIPVCHGNYYKAIVLKTPYAVATDKLKWLQEAFSMRLL